MSLFSANKLHEIGGGGERGFKLNHILVMPGGFSMGRQDNCPKQPSVGSKLCVTNETYVQIGLLKA